MLSIIVSSHKPDLFQSLEKNISESCGCEYELIKIENLAKMPISAAYNKGAQQAKGDKYLFLHEDVKFHTQNWGQKLVKQLSQAQIGVLGVAGSNYVPIAPCGWNTQSQYDFWNLIQYNPIEKKSTFINNVKSLPQKLMAVDGVFIACNKEAFDKVRFDENLKGFHGYDLDFSLRMSKWYENAICEEIILEHFSLGKIDKQWVENTIEIRKKLGNKFQKIRNSEIELNVFIGFMSNYFEFYPINKSSILSVLKFYPFLQLNISQQKVAMSKLRAYYKYRKAYNKKLQDREN